MVKNGSARAEGSPQPAFNLLLIEGLSSLKNDTPRPKTRQFPMPLFQYFRWLSWSDRGRLALFPCKGMLIAN